MNLERLKKHATKDNAAKAAGVATGAVTPVVAISAGGAAFDVAGGAAVMKTLAVVGLGGGAVVGVVVVAAASALLGYGGYRLFNKILK